MRLLAWSLSATVLVFAPFVVAAHYDDGAGMDLALAFALVWGTFFGVLALTEWVERVDTLHRRRKR